ncbi:MAG: hypothetical protein E7369_06225, partial [Clostridiales bacterium]|nr:hypothetical protein [Clostridiales bacterium]
MLKVTHYFKPDGKRSYRRERTSIIKSSDIDDYLKFFPTKDKKKNPNNVVKTKFSNFGRTYTRIVKIRLQAI